MLIVPKVKKNRILLGPLDYYVYVNVNLSKFMLVEMVVVEIVLRCVLPSFEPLLNERPSSKVVHL